MWETGASVGVDFYVFNFKALLHTQEHLKHTEREGKLKSIKGAALKSDQVDVRQRLELFTTSEPKLKSFYRATAGGIIIKLSEYQSLNGVGTI